MINLNVGRISVFVLMGTFLLLGLLAAPAYAEPDAGTEPDQRTPCEMNCDAQFTKTFKECNGQEACVRFVRHEARMCLRECDQEKNDPR